MIATEIEKDNFDSIVAPRLGAGDAALLLGLWVPDREFVAYMRARGYPADYGMATLMKDNKGAFHGEIKSSEWNVKASVTPYGEAREDPDVGSQVFFKPGKKIDNALVLAVGKARHRTCTADWSKSGNHPLSRGVFAGPTYTTLEGR